MSGSRAEQLIEGGLWLRLSGDREWSERLFEEALRLDPRSPALQKMQKASNLPDGRRSHEELWSLLPISIRAWPNPFASPHGFAPRPARPTQTTPVADPALPEVDLEPLEWPAEAAASQAPKSGKLQIPGPSDLDYMLHAAEEFIQLEDPEAAMDLIAKAETIDGNHPQLRSLREKGEAALQNLYQFRIGPLEAVPRVLISAEQIIALRLDHRAGFMLSQIDGRLSFEDLFSLSGMSRLDTTRILSQLLELKVISRA